jgi:putative methyltransferase (TIGR04325 family)
MASAPLLNRLKLIFPLGVSKKLELIAPFSLYPYFNNYSAALALASKSAYENEAIIEVVLHKTKSILANHAYQHNVNDLNLAVALQNIYHTGKQPIEVLDFGGACGLHYFTVRRLLPKSCRLSWTVIETPAMVEAGKTLANDELQFFSDLAAVQGQHFDVVHSSGTLQCVPDPIATLEALTAFKAPCMVLNRVGIHAGKNDLITLHRSKLSWNGAGGLPEGIHDRELSYPFQFVAANKFYAALNHGYERLYHVQDNSGIFPIQGSELVGFSALYGLKEAS